MNEGGRGLGGGEVAVGKSCGFFENVYVVVENMLVGGKGREKLPRNDWLRLVATMELRMVDD